ncbi:MAG: hypothetical protein EOO88_33955 [Pedobacter sp.]|nr:MAG: hypothetical protein EOO88_33955 [Pedobacter sp.]
MGKLYGGIYGRVHGKVGNLVHYQLMGEEIIRMVGKSMGPPSVRQLACRMEMAVVVAFFKPMVEFINLGYRAEAALVNKLPNNLAVSYNKKYALTGSYPEVAIDYAKARVAEGTLSMADGAAVLAESEGLKFTWDVPAGLDWNEKGHLAMTLAYFPMLNKAVYCMAGAKRKEGVDMLHIPKDLRGEYMETYLSFLAVGDNVVANSVYTGSFNKPA